MGCSGSRIGDDAFEKEYRNGQQSLNEVEKILNKIGANTEEPTSQKKLNEINKKKETITKLEREVSKSIEALNSQISINNHVVGTFKADKEARLLALTNKFVSIQKRIKQIYNLEFIKN